MQLSWSEFSIIDFAKKTKNKSFHVRAWCKCFADVYIFLCCCHVEVFSMMKYIQLVGGLVLHIYARHFAQMQRIRLIWRLQYYTGRNILSRFPLARAGRVWVRQREPENISHYTRHCLERSVREYTYSDKWLVHMYSCVLLNRVREWK